MHHLQVATTHIVNWDIRYFPTSPSLECKLLRITHTGWIPPVPCRKPIFWSFPSISNLRTFLIDGRYDSYRSSQSTLPDRTIASHPSCSSIRTSSCCCCCNPALHGETLAKAPSMMTAAAESEWRISSAIDTSQHESRAVLALRCDYPLGSATTRRKVVAMLICLLYCLNVLKMSCLFGFIGILLRLSFRLLFIVFRPTLSRGGG